MRLHFPPRLPLSIASVGAMLSLASCAPSGLDFVRDDRLAIIGLEDRSEIELPLNLAIEVDGPFPDSAGATAIAVLVDWTPPPPGKPLESLLEDDPVCQGEDGCPEGYLERNRIVVLQPGPYLLDNVPVGTDRDERRGFHELTVVFVDDDGNRVGEASDFARFRVPGIDR